MWSGKDNPVGSEPGLNLLLRLERVGKDAEEVTFDGGRRVDHVHLQGCGIITLQQKKNATSRCNVAWAVE